MTGCIRRTVLSARARIAIVIFLCYATRCLHAADAASKPVPVGSLVPTWIHTISPQALIGRWGGGDTNDLHCQVVFGATQAKIFTFRAGKHLSTVNSWWRIENRGRKVVLGINGEALVCANHELQLKLTRQFDHLVVLSNATLKKIDPLPRTPR